MKEIKTLIEENKIQIVNNLKEFIAQKGVLDLSTKKEGSPFGKDVYNSLKYIENLGRFFGFDVTNYDGYCVEISYGKGKECVNVLAHCDVVPEGKGWNSDPYEAVVIDDAIYGRGVSDDKGPGLAALYALKFIKDNNIKLNNRINIIFGGNEETGSLCMEHYFETLKKPHGKYGFTPDADFPLIYGEKGIFNYEFYGEYVDNVIESIEAGLAPNSVIDKCVIVLKKVYNFQEEFEKFLVSVNCSGSIEFNDNKTILNVIGVASHGAFPEGGINGLSKALEFIKKHTESKLANHFGEIFKSYYGDNLGINHESNPMGKLTMNLGIGKYNGNNYSFIINVRYPNNLNVNDIVSKINKHVMHEGKLLSNSDPLYVDPNSDFIKALLTSYQEVTKDYESKPFTIGGGTYAKETKNCVAFGMTMPHKSRTGNIHSINECLELSELYQGIEIFYNALIRLGNM